MNTKNWTAAGLAMIATTLLTGAAAPLDGTELLGAPTIPIASGTGVIAGGVGLMLSGHTHGGQIWPFGYLVRLAVPFVAGRYRRGDSELYVSSGTGFWGPPMRLFAPAELTEITLRSEGAAEAG